MSTRSAIARSTGEKTFNGRYVHFDGQPSGVGCMLWDIYHDDFGGDLDRMLAVLIDEHPAGWSSIDGYWNSQEDGSLDTNTGGAICYCHGGRNERACDVTDENGLGMGLDFAYVFDTTEDGRHKMQILTTVCARNTECMWAHVGTIDLDRRQPDWERLDTLAQELVERSA